MKDLQEIEVIHGMATVEPGVTPHYVTAGSGDRVIVLLRGFPQRWWEWRRLIPALVGAGYRVIAPDRGAGHSSRPLAGYDKQTMAKVIRALVRAPRAFRAPLCWSATISASWSPTPMRRCSAPRCPIWR